MSKLRRVSVFAALAVAAAGSLFAVGQAPDRPWQPPPAELECRFTEGPVTLNGKADEPAWKHAQVIDNFYLPWLGKDARPAKTSTSARLLWDREHLYFFAEMEDADLVAGGKEEDSFSLFLKPADGSPGYYEFQVNPAGTLRDTFLPQRGKGAAKGGTPGAEVKVRLRGTLNRKGTDAGWSVEGRIPWKDLLRTGGRPEAGEAWKFALGRTDCSAAGGTEVSTCAPLRGKADFHRHEEHAALRFVRDGRAARPHGIEKQVPLTTSRVVGSPEPPLPFVARRALPKLNVTYPIAVTHQPGSDRLLFLASPTSSGPTRLHRVKDDPAATPKDVETVLDLSDVAFDFTFHPRFADNGFFYVGSNGSRDGKPKMTRVTRYAMQRATPYKVDPASAKVIIEWESDGHNGAAVAFGHDGMLYVTSGDGTSDSDTRVVGQDMTSLLAKVLRIDVDRPEPGKGYAVPKDNPFVATPGARPEIWALGLRNPWRMTVDQKTGHLWVAQNGQDLWEQAFLVKKGDNYGWSVTEGSHPFYPGRKKGPNFFTRPTVEHPHSEARSLTGGIVYHGKKHPELVGAYLYGDYSTGRIWGVKHDGAKVVWHREVCDSRLALVGFGVDAQGELLIADHKNKDGGFYTFEANPAKGTVSSFPRKLSESGLFKSVKGHVMAEGLIPYTVNAVLWSDGANKERWLGVPEGGKIEYAGSRGWNFPDRTVVVKSFYLEAEEGNPASRRWVETRFLTRQGGEWFGYSYAWDEAQAEGTLVEATGRDREYVIKVPRSKDHPDGVRKQTWHYPSRTECMVCHSRAANWVLGLSTVQMNKDHDYGKVRDNQLRVLEHLGLFRVNHAEEMRNQLREEGRAKGMNDGQVELFLKERTRAEGQREAKESSLLARNPENLTRLVDPYDRNNDLGLRARSYLHSNCAQCHVEAGGGNAQMELELTTPPEKMRLIGVRPVHDTFGIADAKLVYPGHPEKSVLLRRIDNRDRGHMPPLATSMVDRAAVELLRDWITELGRGKAGKAGQQP